MCVVLVGSPTDLCRYLTHEELAKHPASRVHFVPPLVAVLINKGSRDVEIPHFIHAGHMFIPIGGGCDPRPGSHWPLLVVSSRDRRAFYYDSYRLLLVTYAKDPCQVIGGWLGFKLDFVDLNYTRQQRDSNL